ncbi:hypothetical protein CPB86DRAFT_817130 [Serendipita vermifera]|nr:hypothetical protein CPB86DRAFT_817130 [Serendipita vermifera]
MFFGYKCSNFLLSSALILLIGKCRADDYDYSPPTQNYTLPPGITLDRLFTVDTSVLAAPITTVGGNCTAPTQSLIRGGGLTVILPAPINVNATENTPECLDSLQTKALNDSLPYILEQLWVKPKCIPDLVDKGIHHGHS